MKNSEHLPQKTYNESYTEASDKLRNKKRPGFFSQLFGIKDEEDEDLEFIFSNYAHANENPNKFSNLVFIFITIFFTGMIIWAAIAEIDELARGNGKVIPSDKIQTVQSLDGGIISEILVKEGQTIIKNAPIMKIDTTRFQATLEENRQEYYSLLAIRERLKIEANVDIQKDLPNVEFPKEVLEDSSRYDKLEKNSFRK